MQWVGVYDNQYYVNPSGASGEKCLVAMAVSERPVGVAMEQGAAISIDKPMIGKA